MNIIISHTDPAYGKSYDRMTLAGRNNGAFYYSQEICRNIIPNVHTERPWVTIRAGDKCVDHAIVFIHNNLHPERYEWLKPYKDLILVCGVNSTCEKVKQYGTPIYLPLSIDVEEVKKFTCEKTCDTAYAGRPSKREGIKLASKIDYLEGLDRKNLLAKMARYKKVYAVGRTAIEAKALGCEILPYDPRYPDPSIWQVIDNRDAAVLLSRKLRELDSP